MAKQGMKRPERTHTQPHNTVAPVPEIQGKAKSGKKHVRPIVAAQLRRNKRYIIRSLFRRMMTRTTRFLRLTPKSTAIWQGTISKTIFPLRICRIYNGFGEQNRKKPPSAEKTALTEVFIREDDGKFRV